MVARRDELGRSGRQGGSEVAERPAESDRSGPLVRRTRETSPSPRGSDTATPHARWPLVALVAVLVVLGVDLYGLFDARRVNAMLAGDEIALLAERDTARGRLAHAYRLHTEGKIKEAIAAYGTVTTDSGSDSGPELRKVQYFNLASLYLERAVALEREDEIQSAMSLVELAKQNYREILAQDPHHWDSRYNLSRALEMLPDIAAVDYENERNPERSPQAPQAARTYEGLP